MKKLLSLILSFLLLASLCACNSSDTAPSTTQPGLISPTGPLYDRTSYTVADADAIAAQDLPVMKVGDYAVKNSLFQFSYWMEYSSFVEAYGSYTASLGLSLSLPLDQQFCTGTTYTWQQYFIRETLSNLHESIALYLAWQTAGQELPEAIATELAQLEQTLEKTAEDKGFESAEQFLLQVYGPGITREDFVEYMQIAYLGDLYYNYRLSQIEVTDQQIEDYFNQNQQDLAMANITKDGTKVYHVRHILLSVAEDADEATWEKTSQDAQKLLDQWLAGEATQASFIELVKEHSKDTDSVDYGGLYEGCVADSNFSQEFRDWYLAEDRQAGDYGIIKTEAGYHLMYHVGTEEYWHYRCGLAVFNTLEDQICADVTTQHALEVDYGAIALGVAASTVFEAEENE